MNIVKIAAYSAFAVTPPKDVEMSAKMQVEEILKKYKVFGVFATIERYYNLELNKNERIHGCIGQWDNEYKPLSLNVIFNYIKDVSRSAAVNDTRRYRHPPLNTDPNATIEISFMLLPIFPIDPNSGMLSNGILFNNEKYGLIAQEDGTRGTYLPKVFTNNGDELSWIDIRNSLVKDKIGHDNIKDYKFYAYETYEVKTTLNNDDLLDTLLIGNSFNNGQSDSKMAKLPEHFKLISNFFLNNYKKFIPYAYKNGVISIRKSENVRNIASMYDVLLLADYFQELSKLRPIIQKNANYYIEEYKNDPLSLRQASAFLILLLDKLNKNIYKIEIDNITRNLYENLEFLEPNFELGEALTALAYIKEDNCNLCDFVKTFLEQERNMPIIDNIFKYNWHSKFLLALYKTDAIKCQTCNNPKKYVIDYVILLQNNIIKIIKQLFLNNNNNNNIETNYLAVAFESLNALQIIVRSTDALKIIDNLEEMLSQRFDKNIGLYKFNDGSARIDITGHIIETYITSLNA
jgi:AMMECR1 domain-containing protein